MMSAELKAEPSLGTLIASLARNTSTLVQQEVQLATAEMTAKAKQAGKDVGVIFAGGALIQIGVLALVAAIVAGLSPMVPVWLSSIVIAIAAAGGGYALVRMKLKAMARLDPIPRQTVRILSDDVEAVSHSHFVPKEPVR